MNKLKAITLFTVVLLTAILLSSCFGANKVQDGYMCEIYMDTAASENAGKRFLLSFDNKLEDADHKLVTCGANNSFLVNQELDKMLRSEELPAQLDFCYTYPDMEFVVFSEYFKDTVQNFIWIRDGDKFIKTELPENHHYLNNIRIENKLYMISYPDNTADKNIISIPVTIFDLVNHEFTHHDYKINITDYLSQNAPESLETWNNVEYFWSTPNTVTTDGQNIYLVIPTPSKTTNGEFKMCSWYISFELKHEDNIIKISELKREGIGIAVSDKSKVSIITSNDGGREKSYDITIDTLNGNIDYHVIEGLDEYGLLSRSDYYDGKFWIPALSSNKFETSSVLVYDVKSKSIFKSGDDFKGVVETIRICEYKDGKYYNI